MECLLKGLFVSWSLYRGCFVLVLRVLGGVFQGPVCIKEFFWGGVVAYPVFKFD